MKNKFKLFCTFIICLIFLTLVNTNSPQPSADSVGTGEDVQPQVISIQLIPADNVRLIPPSGQSWMEYLTDYGNNGLGRESTKFTIVYKFKMPTNNIEITDYYFKLFSDNKDYSKDYDSEKKFEFDTDAAYYEDTDNSIKYQSATAQDNGYIHTVTWSITKPDNLRNNNNGTHTKIFDNENSTWKGYNLGDSIVGYLKGTYGSDQSFDIPFSNNSTKSSLFESSNADRTSQTCVASSPIKMNNNTKLTSKYRGYDLMQRCYNYDKDSDKNSDTHSIVINNNSDAFKTKEYVGDPDRTYSTEETNKPKVLVVDPTYKNDEVESTDDKFGVNVIENWFNPGNKTYNENYTLDIFDPVNFHDLSSKSLSGSPLFNYKEKPDSNDIKGGALDIETIPLEEFNKNTITDDDLKQYKVIVFGTWDSNRNKDLSQEGLRKCINFMKDEHHSIILGHDTAITDVGNFYSNGARSPYAFYKVTAHDDGSIDVQTNNDHDDQDARNKTYGNNYHPYFCALAQKYGLIDTNYSATWSLYANGYLAGLDKYGTTGKDALHQSVNGAGDMVDPTSSSNIPYDVWAPEGDIHKGVFFDSGEYSYAGTTQIFFDHTLPPRMKSIDRNKFYNYCLGYNGLTALADKNISSHTFQGYNVKGHFGKSDNIDYTSKMFGTYVVRENGIWEPPTSMGNSGEYYSTIRTSFSSTKVQYDYPNKVVFGRREVDHGDYRNDEKGNLAGRTESKDYSILKVPPCHTVGQRLNSNAKVFLAFCGVPDLYNYSSVETDDGSYEKAYDNSGTHQVVNNEDYYLSEAVRKEKGKPWNYYTLDNFYLASDSKERIFMFQTGHSSGLASVQERQIWANLLVSLVSGNAKPEEKTQAVKLMDSNSPKVDSASLSNSKSTDLNVDVTDRETLNSFLPNTRDVSKTDVSLGTPDDYSFSAGLKGYSYFFSDDDFGVGDSDSVSSKEDQDKYTSGDYETYTFDSWSKFNSDVNTNSSDIDISNAEEAFKNSKVVKNNLDTASIDLNENVNSLPYLYICLFDNSTRMAKDGDELSKLGYDGLADGDNLPVLQNTNDNLDETLKDEWNKSLNVNWETIRKYGNRTVIRIKLADNKVTTHITNSHYIDDSSPNRFWTNKSNRSDSIATTGDEKITTVTKFSKNADSSANKIIALGKDSKPSASNDNAVAWINPENNSFEKNADIVKNIKVVKTESTGDFITYTVEWTIAGKHFSNSNTDTLFYNYAYIDSYNPVSNGCQENFTVDVKPPRVSSKPDSPSKYQIKVSDSDNTKGELYQSGIKSIEVNLINSDGDREETSCSFTREGNERVNEKILTLERDLTDYSKIEVITEDNVGNKAKSLIPLANKPKETNSGEIHASLKNWYYSSGSHNKWVSGSNNPSTINTSNNAYVSIDNPTYNLIRNENYAAQMVKFKAIQGGYSLDGEDEPSIDKYDGYSEANLIFNTSVGTFNPGAYECYDTLGGELKLGTLKNNSNKYIKISKGAKVTDEYESPNKNLDKYTYFSTIPLTGLKDFVGNKISMNILNEQTISATQKCHYYTYTEKDGIISPAWDEYDEETGEFIKHHDAVPGKIKVENKNDKTVKFTENESIRSSVTLADTLSVDATKPTISISKTGRYTNKVTIKDLDNNDKTTGASGIHKIKLGLSNSSTTSIDSCKSAFDGSNEYLQNSVTKSYVDCWKGQSPKNYENTVNVSPVHELTFDLDCFSSDNVPDYLHKKVDTDKYTVYKYLIYEIEDNVGNKITGSKDLNPTVINTTITEDGRPPKDYPEDNTPDRPSPSIPINPNGPEGKLYDKNVSINANPTEITDPKDNSKKRKIVDVEVNASITNPTPGFSPKLEIWGYGKNDEYRRPSDFSNLINKSNKDEMSKFGERPLTKDTYTEIYVDDTYNTPNKPTAHVDISSTASLLKFKELEDPKLPYFFEVYTKTCNAEDWIKEVDTLHPLYFASGYDHDRIVIYKVDGDHREPNEYWKNNPVLSGKYYGTGSGEGSVDISNLRTGWYKAELIMYDFNGNPSGKEELWFYQNQPALYTPFNVSISAVKDVDWEGDVRFNYKETRVLPSGINSDVKDNNSNSYVNKDIEINQDSNRRPCSFVSDTGDSDYYPLGLNFGANGDSLKRIDWTNSDKTSYNKPKEDDTDKGNPIAKGYAVNWNFSKENKQQLNSLSLNYSYTTTSGDSLTIYSSDGSTKLTDDPSNGLYVDSQELTQTQLDALNSSVDNSDSLNGYLKPPSFDPSKSMFTKIPVKHYLPENFVAKTSSGSVYNGVVIVTVTFKCAVKEGTMSTNAVDQSMDLYAIYQGETALDDVTLDRQR